jgi:hypothetical protein
MSEKKWPIVDNRTDQLSKLRPVKACECLNYLLDGRPCFRLCKVVTAGAAWLTCSTWLGSTPSAPHCGQIQVPHASHSISLSMHSICQPVPHVSHSSIVSSGSVKWQISHARLASGLASELVLNAGCRIQLKR